jgi:hypothetical protein
MGCLSSLSASGANSGSSAGTGIITVCTMGSGLGKVMRLVWLRVGDRGRIMGAADTAYGAAVPAILYAGNAEPLKTGAADPAGKYACRWIHTEHGRRQANPKLIFPLDPEKAS